MPSDSRSNWVTAAATVAGVVIAGVALLVTVNSDDDDKTDQQAGQPKPPAVTTGSAVTPASPAAGSPAGGSVVWQGSVLLDGTPIGFDSGQAQRGNTSTDMSSDLVLESGSTARKWFGSRLAAWTGSAPPEREDCAAQIDTWGVEELRVDVGTAFCLRTDEGRFAYIVVRSRSGDGYGIDVTLWSNA